jgi:hypothetical protein
MPAIAANYQDQGFEGTAKQSPQAALTKANREVFYAKYRTPVDQRDLYRSSIRWEGDGYGWYWILR